MNIRIHSADMNRMMKIVNQCVDKLNENVEVIHDNNLLTVRGTNGVISVVATTPLLGGDGESFCVDGAMLTRVCAEYSGTIQIETSDRVCTVRGAGRTRLPIVASKVKAFEPVTGESVTVKGNDLRRCYEKVRYAISPDQVRVALTGVLVSSESGEITLTALDGFQLAVEKTACEGDGVHFLAPRAFMEMVSKSVLPDDNVKITTDGKCVQVTTDDLMANCPLLLGEFPDCKRIMPTEFQTEVLVETEKVINALKCGQAIQNKTNAVKIAIADGVMKITNNSEQADYEAEVACDVNGEDISTAFNEKYLLSALSMTESDETVLKLGGAVKPAIAQGKGKDGIHLLLPVRIFEAQ